MGGPHGDPGDPREAPERQEGLLIPQGALLDSWLKTNKVLIGQELGNQKLFSLMFSKVKWFQTSVSMSLYGALDGSGIPQPPSEENLKTVRNH